MAFALSHLAALALLGLLAWAMGRLLDGLGLTNAALGFTVSRMALGLATWMLVLFALAAAGSYRPSIVATLAVAVLAGAAALAARAWLRRDRSSEARPRSDRAATVRVLLLSAPCIATLLALAFATLSPGIGWDDDVYHLTLPKLYLAHGGFRPIAFNVYSHWPHGVELLYGAAMMLQDHVLAKLVHTGFALLLLVATYRICVRHTSRPVAMGAALLVLGNPVLTFEATRAYVDIACALFFLVAVACADEYVREARRGALLASGIACGALAATKLSGLVGVACVGVLLLATRIRGNGAPRAKLWHEALWLGAPVLVLAAPWFIKSALYTGNPLYPLLYARLGGIEWSSELGVRFSAWQQGIGPGRSWLDYLKLPYRVATQGGDGYHAFDGEVSAFWVGAVPFALLLARWAPATRSYLLCASLYFVSWALTSQQMRFLIPVLAPLSIATALAAHEVIARLDTPQMRSRVAVAFYVVSVVVTLGTFEPEWRAGLHVASTLRRTGAPDLRDPTSEGYAFLNEHTPENAKVMLLNINLGFFLDRAYIADSFFEASQMRWLIAQARSPRALVDILRERAITHIYVAENRWRIDYPEVLDELLKDKQLVERVHRCQHDRCRIYALR